MHCDFAFFVGGTPDNAHDLPELERLPGCAGVKLFMGSSTGALLVEDDESLRRIFPVFAAASRFMPRTSIASASARGCGSKAIRPRIRCGAMRPRRCRAPQRLVKLAQETGKRPCAACLDQGGDRFLSRPQGRRLLRGDPAASTLAAPDCYQRLGTRAQMNPPCAADHRDGMWRGSRRA